ncbi:MAG: 1-deoxy-D-xylulose-5-phosphate reductoisomerase [Actinomycetota bacterium]
MTVAHRRVVVLGSTGSIGRQALDVIAAHPDRFSVVGLAAGSDAATLEEQARAFGVKRTGLGSQAAIELAGLDQADIVLNAIVGAAGLRASIAALDAGKTLALANKESLVAGGEACLESARAGGGAIVPVDSEHAALAQCLARVDRDEVSRIVITASGGPFRERTDFDGITVDEALAHPTWSMGPKITVDSATLVNKGLEVIEAHYLFGFDYDDIEVVVHPQSVVHGLIHMRDGSTIAQMAPADMRIPIQAALSAPDRIELDVAVVDLTAHGSLSFEPVDTIRFRGLALAFDVGRKRGTYPAVFNAANEVAVAAFLESRLAFQDIASVIEQTVADHVPSGTATLEAVLEADAWARDRAATMIDSPAGVGA